MTEMTKEQILSLTQIFLNNVFFHAPDNSADWTADQWAYHHGVVLGQVMGLGMKLGLITPTDFDLNVSKEEIEKS